MGSVAMAGSILFIGHKHFPSAPKMSRQFCHFPLQQSHDKMSVQGDFGLGFAAIWAQKIHF